MPDAWAIILAGGAVIGTILFFITFGRQEGIIKSTNPISLLFETVAILAAFITIIACFTDDINTAASVKTSERTEETLAIVLTPDIDYLKVSTSNTETQADSSADDDPYCFFRRELKKGGWLYSIKYSPIKYSATKPLHIKAGLKVEMSITNIDEKRSTAYGIAEISFQDEEETRIEWVSISNIYIGENHP